MSNAPTEETVLEVEHFTDRLFAFSITRPSSFRFRTGEFIMIGLPKTEEQKRPVMRAYSVASPAWDDKLEFYSIKVPDGPLTSRLQAIKTGDTVLLGRKPVGTLVLDALLPGKRLWMFSTGTGFAPFASLIRDPETYERFDEVIVTHTCREGGELQYSQRLVADLVNDPLVGEMVVGEDGSPKLKLITSLTREDHALKGRITTLIETGKLSEIAGTPPLDPAHDRVMICGSKDMIDDTAALVEGFGLREGSNSEPREFVIEKAFVG
ncbi:ferredoxin--NADP reductase [uncultured Algimonas sp.]|uniref:ferredoxin--NADP reductase n=1 Tax=uncultured Algimonas sp. TaxID=1547920 RepID=UPI00262241B3|nr:ferredoxin--NADP reductase [uncultured Algimonas sp.]